VVDGGLILGPGASSRPAAASGPCVRGGADVADWPASGPCVRASAVQELV